MTGDIHKYLLLDEERNAMDFLTQSLTFLSMVEQNRFYLKWFIISFHGTLYSFMLLVLQGVNHDQIYRVKPKYFENTSKKDDLDLFEGRLIDFMRSYGDIKIAEKTDNHPYVETGIQRKCMEELNFKLRNQMIHFKPMVSAYEPWYPAEVCSPLLEVLMFCISFHRVHLSVSQKSTAIACIKAIDTLLTKYKEDEELQNEDN
jgi:hypothetical protein